MTAEISSTVSADEITHNDVVYLSNCQMMQKTIGSKRLRVMLQKYINEWETKVTRKQFLCRILIETQRLNPPIRFMRYDLETRKYFLMDARDALKLISLEIKVLRRAGVSQQKKSNSTLLLNLSGTKKKVCNSEECRATTIANLLTVMKQGLRPMILQRQGNTAHSGKTNIITNRDQSNNMVDKHICSANEVADVANKSQQTQAKSPNLNNTSGTIGEPEDVDIIVSTSGAELPSTFAARQLFRRVLEEGINDYSATGDNLQLISRTFSKLQKLNPPMRFLRRNSVTGGYSICGVDAARNAIEKCFDGLSTQQRLQSADKMKTINLGESKELSYPVTLLEQQQNMSLRAKTTKKLSLPPALPDLNKVQVAYKKPAPNQVQVAPFLQAIPSSKQSQVETRAMVPSPLCTLSPSEPNAPGASFNTTKTNHRPFVATLPTPQSIQAAYINPTQANHPILQVLPVPTIQPPQFGSAIGEGDGDLAKLS